MKRGFVQQKNGHWPRSTRRSVGIRLPDLAIQVPVSSAGPSNTLPVNQQVFRGQSFCKHRSQPLDECFSCRQKGHWANQLPVPAALQELLQSLQAARPQTDNKNKLTLQRLGKDECNLVNLVTC